MTALYITLGVLLAVGALLFARIKIKISYNTISSSEVGDDIKLSVSYLFVRLKILPAKEKKIRLRKFTYKKTHPKKKKAEKAATEKKKKQKKKKGAAASATKKGSPEKKEETEGSGGIVRIISQISDIISDVIGRFPSKLRLDILHFYLSVGGRDAMSAAITYGAAVEAVGAALTMLECSPVDTHRPREECYRIEPDFVSGKIKADIRLALSIRAGSLIRLGLSLIVRSVVRLINGGDG
ncbi:MAG: hypothetical protein LUH43_01945 [Clostridia bacterium]|nr:hypothetical protein [Clostridia bacterium]